MPFRHDKRPPLKLDRIATDEEAVSHLPPFPIARKTYENCRLLGSSPADALGETLTLWRELQEGARPA